MPCRNKRLNNYFHPGNMQRKSEQHNLHRCSLGNLHPACLASSGAKTMLTSVRCCSLSWLLWVLTNNVRRLSWVHQLSYKLLCSSVWTAAARRAGNAAQWQFREKPLHPAHPQWRLKLDVCTFKTVYGRRRRHTAGYSLCTTSFTLLTQANIRGYFNSRK